MKLTKQEMLFVIWFKNVWLSQLHRLTTSHINKASELLGENYPTDGTWNRETSTKLIHERGLRLMDRFTEENIVEVFTQFPFFQPEEFEEKMDDVTIIELRPEEFEEIKKIDNVEFVMGDNDVKPKTKKITNVKSKSKK